MEARTLIEQLRAVTSRPILLDGLAEPTVDPLGMADRGVLSHRNRFRRTNLALAELVEGLTTFIWSTPPQRSAPRDWSGSSTTG